MRCSASPQFNCACVFHTLDEGSQAHVNVGDEGSDTRRYYGNIQLPPPSVPLIKKICRWTDSTCHADSSQPNAPILVLLAFVGKQFWLQLTCTYTLTCVWLTFDYAYFLMKILPLPSSYLFPANRASWSVLVGGSWWSTALAPPLDCRGGYYAPGDGIQVQRMRDAS